MEYQDAPDSFRRIAMEVRNLHRISGETRPSIHVLLPNGELQSTDVPIHMMEPDNKPRLGHIMREMAKQVKAIALASEAWTVEVSKKNEAAIQDVMEDACAQQLYQREDKIEVIMLSYCDPEVDIMGTAKIDCKKVQEWSLLSSSDYAGEKVAAGTFSNFYR